MMKMKWIIILIIIFSSFVIAQSSDCNEDGICDENEDDVNCPVDCGDGPIGNEE